MTRFPMPRAMMRRVSRYLDIRRRVRIERDLDALPHDIRKDIGWPDRWSDRRGGS